MKRYAIEIIRSFNQKDKIKFGRFLKNKYFNKKNSIISFYNFISKYCHKEKFKNKETESNLTLKFICEKLNRNKTTISKRLLLLEKLCEEYLVKDRLETHKNLRRTILIDELQGRGISKAVLKHIEYLERDLNKNTSFTKNDFLTRYNLENNKLENGLFWKVDKNKTEINDQVEATLKSNRYLFHYYLLSCNETFLNIINSSSDLIEPFKINEFVKFYRQLKLEYKRLERNNLVDNYYQNVFDVYFLMENLALKKNLFHNFNKLKKLLEEIGSSLDIDERYNMFAAYQYLFPEIAKEKDKQHMELDFYRLYFKHKAYLNTGQDYITIRGFRNFLMRGDDSQLNDGKKWADDLIKNHINAVEPNYRKSVIAIREAYVKLKAKKYDEAIECLSRIDPQKSEQTIERDLRFYYILIYYETKEFDLMNDYIKKLRRYLQKVDLPDLSNHVFNIFLDFTIRLRRLAMNINLKDDIELDRLKSEILTNSIFPAKEWLLREIKKLHTELNLKERKSQVHN
ncbi:MAG TPA: hypothetical protein DCY06_09645 [Bacteroidetes bacterium]|nr:hypothetical protein [Bacteroidota bacterium]HRK00674.1 hypothetical protein [Ignavibacteria bacterium]